MQTLLRISRFIDALNERIGRYLSWTVLLAVLVCSLNAILRKLFDTSAFYKTYANAMSETQLFLFGAMFLLGAAYTLRLDEHVRIDLLSSRWSERRQAIMDVIGFALFLLPVSILIFYHSLSFLSFSWHSGETTGNSFLPLWPFKLLIPIGFALLIVQAISELIKRVAYFKGLIPFSQLRRRSHAPEKEFLAYQADTAATQTLKQ